MTKLLYLAIFYEAIYSVQSGSGALRCTFWGNGKTCVAQSSCKLSDLIKQRQDHQKTMQLKVITT